MNAPGRDLLDDAIDRVAIELVSVDHDPEAARRIVAQLPARRTLAGPAVWRLVGPVAAMGTLALVVAVLRSPVQDPVRSREAAGQTAVATQTSEAPQTSEARQTASNLAERPSTSVSHPEPSRTSLNHPEPHRTFPTRLFDLDAIAPPDELSLSALAATAPVAVEPASVDPLAIDGLPLAVDQQPPSYKE